jgi:hypothetical protein
VQFALVQAERLENTVESGVHGCPRVYQNTKPSN